MLLYDPPSGWKYGFPKPYKIDGRSVKEHLIADGYPEKEIDDTVLRHMRFIGLREELDALQEDRA